MHAAEWIGVAGLVLTAVGILVGYLGGRRTERAQRDRADKDRREAERAQRDLVLYQRRVDLYPALTEWAGKVNAKNHLDPEERMRREVIPPDVMADAHSYASDAVLDQLGVMTELRDRDPDRFLRPGERNLSSWEERVSWRRSAHLRREAKVLKAIIRNELSADSLSRERDARS